MGKGARRRRRRERRREDPRARTAPQSAPADEARRERGAGIGVSWLGLAGGLLGALPLAAIGIDALVEPPQAGRWVAAVPVVMSAVYLPAVWASATPTPRRQSIQRGVAAASIVIVLAGLPLFGPVIAVVLMPATALLAIAAGLLFRR